MVHIGIDIGTSYSSVCILNENGQPERVKIATGTSVYGDAYSLPSAVFAETDGNLLLGQAAAASRMRAPQNFKNEFKRDLGQLAPYLLGGKPYLPEDLYKEFFIYIKKCVEDYTHNTVTGATVTFPAMFNENKKKLIESAAKRAGLLDIIMLDEPSAAAYCYLNAGKISEGDKLLVYDLGGGTFDLALIRVKNGKFEPLAQPMGNPRLGGADFDRMIFEDIMAQIGEEKVGPIKANPMNFSRFVTMVVEMAIKAKHHLSSSGVFSDIISVGYDAVEYTLERNRYNAMIAPLIDDTINRVRAILQSANLKQSDVNKVLLVGGASRMPLVSEMLSRELGQPPLKDVDPELAVCEGAVVMPVYLRKMEAAQKKKPKSMSKIIGIDFGTTRSCVAVMEGGEPIIIPSVEGGRSTPSAVAFLEDGSILTGSAAKAHAMVCPEAAACSLIRELGTDFTLLFGRKRVTAQEIASMLLQKLKKDAEVYLGEPVTDAIIAVPTVFMAHQRKAMIEAGRLAGLNVKRLISASSAAALAYGFSRDDEQVILLVDIGGGSTNVSVLRFGDDVFEVLAVGGKTNLGGDDFNQKIVNYIIEEFKKAKGIDLSQDKIAMQRIREAAEKAKTELSAISETNIQIPYICTGKSGVINLDIVLQRSKLEELASDLFKAISTSVDKVMLDAGMTPGDLSNILLIGGMTRMPAVRDCVRSAMGITPNVSMKDGECVAVGAAIQAGVISGDIRGIVLLDVTPYSICVETTGGVSMKMIERNTTLPTKKSQVFSTASDGQTSIEIRVLQGESETAVHNKVLAKLSMNDIPPAPKGVPQIEVTVEAYQNGFVHVSAKDIGTGRKVSYNPVNE